MKRDYYTLVASLPYLPHFTQAERLPLNRQRLRERLTMLHPEDADLLHRASHFLAWQRQPAGRTDAEMANAYRTLVQAIGHPLLLELFEFPVNIRTLMGALRRRRRGQPPPPAGKTWGAGQWQRHIQHYWEHPDFKLAPVFPWLPQARTLLENDAALDLERFLMDLVWQHVDRLAPGTDFSFATVLGYVFKWDMVQLWLSFNAAASQERFTELVAGVLYDYGRIFP